MRKISPVFIGAFAVVIAAGSWLMVMYRNQSGAYQLPTWNRSKSEVAAAKSDKETGYVLVKTKNTKALDEIVAEEGLTEETTNVQDLAKLGIRRYKVNTENSTTPEVAERAHAKLNKANPNADKLEEFVEVDSMIEPGFTPNDPSYSSQWHLPKINAPTAWDSASGSSIIIAIADTGVDPAHPDLVDHLIPGWNVVSNTADTTPVHGHGTAVAGTAAAVGNNAKGVAGIAWNAQILPIRVSNTSDGVAYSSDLAEAIIYAADHGARVVNESYGITSSYTAQNAAQYMFNKGGLVTAAAGNANTLLPDTVTSPYIITVSATTSSDILADYSNRGVGIDVSAPGSSILTTNSGGGVASWSGTSFAAPATAGVLGLIFSTNPQLTPSQAEEILKSTAVDLGSVSWDSSYGWGRINAGAAVEKALRPAPSSDTTPPTNPANLAVISKTSNSVSLSWTSSVDNIAVTGYRVYRGGVQIGTTTGTSYTDSGLAASATYSYTVKAVDLAGNVSGASNAVSTTTSAASVQILSYSVQSKTTTTATITWTTNIPTTGKIEYGPKGKLTNSVSDTNLTATHTVTLTGLTANTNYSYRVSATDPEGVTAIGQTSSFRTARK